MRKEDILKVIGSGLAAGVAAIGVSKAVDRLNGNKHDPNLHPGEVSPGVFVVAGECINFINRTHDGKPMSDDEYQSWKDILKPHID